MKSLIAVSFVCMIAIVQSQTLTKDEKKQMIKSLAEHCASQEGASDADVGDMLNYAAPTTDAGSCMRACVFESFGMLKDDSLNIDTIVDTAVKSIEDPDLAAATRTVAKECATKIVGLKRCELVREYIECNIAGLAERDYDLKAIYDL